jgi:diadenosine tetraphosphate (Ap4A) HIT family hydrolase
MDAQQLDAQKLDAQRSWQLHPQLEGDTVAVGNMALSRVLVMNDSTYPWLILVPRRTGIIEIIDLEEAERTQLMSEISLAAQALKDITRCDKLNIAAIGNVVPQLHVHIVARRRDDPAWPKPVWGAAPPRPYESGQIVNFAQAIRQAVGIL